jgi:nitrile hydratase subunit beta
MQARKQSGKGTRRLSGIVLADGEAPLFKAGDHVRVANRNPTGHYRVPRYVRGKRGVVEMVMPIPELDNEQEGFGRNAGMKRHYYRIAFAMTELWPTYKGSAGDGLRIEVFETWLQRI